MKIEFEGIYVSPVGFERMEQTAFHYYFRFYNDGVVRYHSTNANYDVRALYNQSKGLKTKYKIESDKVMFELHPDDHLTSKWTGTIRNNTIVFEIQNADFEDINGEYTFKPL